MKTKRKILYVLVLCILFQIVCFTSGYHGITGVVASAADTVVQPGQIILSDRVSRDGIEFIFDGQYQVGKFANGDYWVLGPVTIIEITPAFDGHNYGWEVNPVVTGGHGFQDYGYGGGFDPSLVPALPYIAEGIQSIVKTTPYGTGTGRRPCIEKAVVLTVVDEVPPGNGADVFRPPYVGSDKPYYYVSDLRTDLLPSYAPVANMPSLASVAEKFSNLWMDHKGGNVGRGLRPHSAMNDYQPENTPVINNAVLRLMMDDPIEVKMPALINFVQYGIDKIHMVYLGQIWAGGGGHQPGHRIGPAFAAVMLDIEYAKQILSDATFFHGTSFFSTGKNTDGLTLWGRPSTEKAYWDYVIGNGGNRANKDPYGYIDGGDTTTLDNTYQAITAQAHKGEILATHFMPELKEAWNLDEWEIVTNYVDRWVCHGAWTLPDPIAPFDGNKANYGITYGPDPNTGLPIPGDGRKPNSHGYNKDGGLYKSAFVASMWDAYRATAEGADETPPFAAIISPLDGRTISGNVILQASAYGIHGIISVQFKANGYNIGAPVVSPSNITPYAYELSWNTGQIPNGTYELTSLALDGEGNTYESAPVTVTIEGNTAIEPLSIDMDEDIISISVGDTRTLTAAVYPENATNKELIWTSSNIDVATVGTDGTVTGVAAGEATITATISGTALTASCDVTVTAIEPLSIDMDEDIISISVGDTQTLTATVYPENATNKELIWTSSNIDVATVGADGTVTGVAAGEATITATVSGTALTASCNVTVKPLYDFTVSDVSINKNAGIAVEATVTSNNGESKNAVVIFKLIKNDGTVIGLSSSKLYIKDNSVFRVKFHGYSGEEYKVKIFIWDKLDDSQEDIGVTLAKPVEVQ